MADYNAQKIFLYDVVKDVQDVIQDDIIVNEKKKERKQCRLYKYMHFSIQDSYSILDVMMAFDIIT